MPRWTKKKLEELSAVFADRIDPADPKQRRRHQILEAASSLFAKQGYRKTSMDEVAVRSGIAKGTVYLYFKTKADLMIALIVKEKMEYAREVLEALDDELSPRERLRGWLRTTASMTAKAPIISRLVRGDREMQMVLAQMQPRMREESDLIRVDMIAELLDLAARPHRWTEEELKERVSVVTGLLYVTGRFADADLRFGLDIDRFMEVLADMLVDGVADGRHAPASQGREVGDDNE